jgi:hypothetical protein
VAASNSEVVEQIGWAVGHDDTRLALTCWITYGSLITMVSKLVWLTACLIVTRRYKTAELMWSHSRQIRVDVDVIAITVAYRFLVAGNELFF